MPPAKKTLILHAGMGKTGTTAIQHTFWNNRAALARAGIAYPAIGAASGAHHLISPHIMADPTAQMPWRRHLAPGEWAPKVAALPEPRVFMSSELISSAEPDQIAAFCAALAPFFDLRLCLYLRRQDDMIAAGYAQGVKAGTQRPPLEKILENQSNRFNYMETIAPWEAALGRDHLIILPYERGQFHAGDLIRDVLFRTLGLPDLPPGFVHDPAANPNARLSAPATEFKRLVNLLIPDRTRSRAYVAPLSACPPDPKGTHLLGRADRAEVIARFAASNARVAQTYMNRPAGDLFRESLSPDAPETAPRIGPAELRAVATILGQKAPGLFHDLLDLAARKDHSTSLAAAARHLHGALGSAAAENNQFVTELRSGLQAEVLRAETAETEAHRLAAELRKARARAKALRTERDNVAASKAELADVSTGHSWKITKPLRAAGQAARKLRHRAARRWHALRQTDR